MKCIGSMTSRWANGRPIPDPALPNIEHVRWQYETGRCWECWGRVPLITRPHSNRQLLDNHTQDGEELA